MLLKQLPILLITLLASFTALPQNNVVYNINNDNGLSSNHVYCTLVDKNGYLWLGTTDGVYRYSGYTLKKYDYADGLSNKDVWRFQEDAEGRIWLFSISQNIGYIKDNQYHRVYKNTGDLLKVIYPDHNLLEVDDDILFINTTGNDLGTSEIGIIHNDTLTAKVVSSETSTVKTRLYLLLGNKVVLLADSDIYKYDINTWLNSDNGKLPQYSEKVHVNLSMDLETSIEKQGFPFKDNYYVAFNFGGERIRIFDIDYRKFHQVNISTPDKPDEKIIFCYGCEDQLHCITNKRLMTFDSNLNIVASLSIDSLFGKNYINTFANTYFQNDPFWGIVLSTSDNGLYINYKNRGGIQKCNVNLDNYLCVGTKNDSVGYWWSNNENKLIEMSKGGIINTLYIPEIYNVYKVVPYSKERSIIINHRAIMWLNKDNTLSPFLENIDTFQIDNLSVLANDYHSFFYYMTDAKTTHDSIIYVAGTSLYGAYKASFRNRTISVQHIDMNRYSANIYDPVHEQVIYYAFDQLMTIDVNNGRKFSLKQRQLEALGIKGIEKISVDSFGNIYIKDQDNVFVYNYASNKLKRILKGIKLDGVFIDITGNILSIAGVLGVNRYTIQSNGELVISESYPNVKKINYSHLYDVQFSKNYIVLKTNSGVYHIATGKKQVAHTPESNYRLIINNNNTITRLLANDTVTIDQTDPSLGIDVIKPSGAGNMHIAYSLNDNEYTSSGQQIIFPDLSPGSYNKVTTIVSDDLWKSKPIEFYVYVQPYWWQTSTAKKIIFSLSVLTIIGLIYFIVIITRKIVNQTNERRNQRRELELKSIYSQINPHFIFNSLSTAQFFVKKNRNKEAYEHINQFSDLLRSYIKSSRNKYITITDEIENLENYLQLQLTRFENKFDYNINIDPSVNPHVVKIPSLLLQPIVENALNHGIFHSETEGQLNISFTTDKNNKDVLICIVDDNGIGRKRSKEIRGERIRKADSYGTILINELIDTFNKYENLNIEIEYVDKTLPEQGTMVIIKIHNLIINN